MNQNATNPQATRSGPELGPEELQQLDVARGRWRKVQRAAGFARFSAWSLALFAALGLLIGIFDATSAVVGVLLAGFATVEFMGAGMIRKANPKGPVVLGWNQLALLAMIGVYCVYQAYLAPVEPLVSDPTLAGIFSDPASRDALVQQGFSPGLLQLIENPQETKTLFYALIAFGSLLMQGPVALYYFSRRRVIDAYIAGTPPWVLEVQRRAA